MPEAITVRRMLSDLRAISHTRADLQRQLAALAGDSTPEGKKAQRLLVLRITNCNDRITTLERFMNEFHSRDSIAAHADRWGS